VFALAWSNAKGPAWGWLKFYKNQVAKMHGNQEDKNKMIPVWLPPPSTQFQLISGRLINVPEDRIVKITEEELHPLINLGAKRMD
jgi:hypothetical protein